MTILEQQSPNAEMNTAAQNATEQNISKGKGPKGGVIRYGVVLPLAAVFTVGLTLTMAALVAAEFTPQDKTEVASYEINPVVDDIKDPVREIRLEPLKKVEVPPPAPKLPTEKSGKYKEPIIEVAGKEIEFKIADLDFVRNFDIQTFDKDPAPLVRIPPVIPNRFLQGDHSGYCRVRFDISANGKPLNVTVALCTSKQLSAPSIKSVQKWNYTPKIQNGRAVSRSGLETTIRFDLKDKRGELLPLPKGY